MLGYYWGIIIIIIITKNVVRTITNKDIDPASEPIITNTKLKHSCYSKYLAEKLCKNFKFIKERGITKKL